ncbi:MAG: homoserine kinase [Oscillospiraceae bacterium]|nr:homoserine kinase [Oscillospiraceae bacterium]
MIKLRVPASSANMGAGFDTLGVALSLYNRIQIEEISSGIEIYNAGGESFVPRGENNLIYRAMKVVFDEAGYVPSGVRISQNSDIPMTRGLGSSSACIIGGMLAANIISGRRLSYEDIIHLAAVMEGHPDNVGPALFGGFCISLTDGGNTIVKSKKINPAIKFAVMIPDYFVATKKSRVALPEEIPLKDTSFNISRALLFREALVSGDMKSLRIGAEDRLHQQYRKSYVENMDSIFEKMYELGSRATYLSGSGPTILSVLDGNYRGFTQGMKRFFAENEHSWRCMMLDVDNVGAVVSQVR